MVKSSKSSSSAAVAAASLQKVSDQASSSSSSSPKYKGVRKRRWGKYVSEIRLPNSRERIWLGSYDAPEKAARAFDAAQFCLRGRSATFNFPDDPPEIVGAGFMTPAEIQAVAARHAHADPRAPVASGRVDDLDTDTDSFSSNINGSPAAYVSDGSAAQVDFEVTEIPMDNSYLDHIFTLGSDENSIPDFGVFPGFDNYSGDLIIPRVDYWSENNEETLFSASLWNF